MSSFCKCKSYSQFFSKNINVYAIFNDQSFNDALINDVVSFEQLGPVQLKKKKKKDRHKTVGGVTDTRYILSEGSRIHATRTSEIRTQLAFYINL